MLLVSITFGSAKAIDLSAYNPKIEKTYPVQVKTQRKRKEDFFLEEERIKDDIVFIFIALNDFEDPEEYYIVKGSEILKDVKKFYGKSYNRENPSNMSAVYYSSLAEYKDKWTVFDE